MSPASALPEHLGRHSELLGTDESERRAAGEPQQHGQVAVGVAAAGIGAPYASCQCRRFEYEVVAAGASGDLGYLVAYEHVTATVGGKEVSYVLRSTTVFRRESGEWQVVHRHGDPARR